MDEGVERASPWNLLRWGQITTVQRARSCCRVVLGPMHGQGEWWSTIQDVTWVLTVREEIPAWERVSAETLQVWNAGAISFRSKYRHRGGFPVNASDKEPTYQCRRHKRYRFDPWIRKLPWRRAWKPTPVFLPRESHVDRGAWWATVHGVTESEATEVTEHPHIHPYKYSCHEAYW